MWNRNWGLLGYRRYAMDNARKCKLSDVTTVIVNSNGRWKTTNVYGSVFGCSNFKSGGALDKLGASTPVLRDFYHYFKPWCDPSH